MIDPATAAKMVEVVATAIGTIRTATGAAARAVVRAAQVPDKNGVTFAKCLGRLPRKT
jgi:hypothetical protein